MDASLLSELVVQIFRVNGALAAWGDRFAAESGLTTARWQVLGAISMTKEPATAPQIAERMGITRQGVQKQLNLLRNEGLVSALENPAHKRSPQYSLTEHGEQKLAEIRKRWRQQVEQWSGAYQQDSVIAALETLDVLSQHLKE
ncbi:MAG: helix-turn-helix domain-containing protein [Rothia sp. (in: high G+C Gram-positive bacteria)]|uniref:MarR family winged helix-turn-helix transcriptional regulator n=1 Tax=Rothia sp. (in: high G+C Gram-positive bacteria) TaxID=1885016 RepID=UPI0026DC31A3|nr:helix-turn-helix domain-containing protein [Rothia sp. (in: high G+C Gram-positive bacteria)]MDO4884316.1 helix-turn-helix domain-containing protein [Rothia sp. (in: high G+C Gram-positive bacteria)]